jgi:hypothetical protein
MAAGLLALAVLLAGIAWVVHPLLSLLVPGLWLCIAVHATNTV